MTSKVGSKGQVVIPKPIRDRIGVQPGDEVEFEIDRSHRGEVRLRHVRSGASLAGKFKGLGMLQSLEADHRREVERDQSRTKNP